MQRGRQNMLFHISEESGIERFEPRASKYTNEPVVWAIDAYHLRNYLLPRECPRVTYYAGNKTTAEDVERFLGSSPAVVAIESSRLEQLRCCRLYCYHLESETFENFDESAGYFVSRVAVVPAHVEVFDDLMGELLNLGVELRFLPNLWPIRDAIVASSLEFSIIRMHNARQRET